MSLAKKLDEIREGGKKKIPPELFATMGQATVNLRASGILDGVIKVGAALPAFEMTNMRGVAVSSQSLLSRGAVVLTVFRGHW